MGFATSDRQVRVNGRLQRGNITLFDGDALESQDSLCRIHVKNGAEFSLGNQSRAHLSAQNIDLDSGSARIYSSAKGSYATRALGLTVRTDLSSSGTVAISGRTLEVTALSGNLHVINNQGTVIANVAQGQSVNLSPDSAGKTEAYSLTGCVVNYSHNFYLTDVTAGVTVELRGAKLPAGKVVTVMGNATPDAHPGPQVSQVINVEHFRQLPGSCKQMSPTTAVAVGVAGGAVAGGTIAVTSGALGASVAGVGAAAAAGAVVAGVAASASHSGVGVTATNPPVTLPNCTSPCYLH
jgi:hypothetical protein